jgi:uncharacterized protein (TIGR00255 family)
MIHSMTAFGATTVESQGLRIDVELRSVNSRYLDLIFRLPDEWRQLEPTLRERLMQRLQRGKVELRLSLRRSSEAMTAIDRQALAAQIALLRDLASFMPEAQAPRLTDLLNLPGVRLQAGLDEPQIQSQIMQTLDQAIDDLIAARQREGGRLAVMMQAQLLAILQRLDELLAVLPELVAQQRERLHQRLIEALQGLLQGDPGTLQVGPLADRLNQESLLLAMRSDVAEELQRLRAHVEEFRQILEGRGARRDGSLGKRLDFLCQEMNREANTLGSKTSHLAMSRCSMDLKLLIEQIREQVQNIE